MRMRYVRELTDTTAFRWALTIAGGFIGMAVLLFGFIYWQTAVYERQRIDGLITREVTYISSIPPSEALAALNLWVSNDIHAVRYGGLFNSIGRHVGGNLLDLPKHLTEDGQARRAVFARIDRDHDGDEPEVVRAVAVRLADRQLLIIGNDIDELEDVNEIILRALSLGLVPAVLLALVGGVVLSRRAERRIASVHEAVGRIMRGELGERLPTRGSGDDMDRLATAVTGMLQEIEHLVLEIRGVGDAIAHDLRTPLTRVRTRLERARDEARTPEAFQICIDRTLASVDQALSVVSAILRIGEIEHGRRRLAFEDLNLAEIARDAFELYEPLADDAHLSLQLRVQSDVFIHADRELLLEATGNLLDNALKFAPSGTEVLLSVELGSGAAILRVVDRGPGIPEAEREWVLRRFYRGEKSRTVQGHGLGLSLVSAIVSLHRFTLEIQDAHPGCAVSIRCPVRVRKLSGRESPSLERLGDPVSLAASSIGVLHSNSELQS